jgi:hypothetical protein
MSEDPDNVVHLFREGIGDRVQRQMVEDWEKAFLAVGQSLTDEETATSLRVTLSFMSHLIHGHFEVGQITADQRDSLLWWLHTGTYAADELQK